MCNSKYTITIPEPCHEDWSKMTPEQQGRFCGVCSKTVVDFSAKSAQEVDAIIEEKKGEKVCGRFRADQVSVPVTLSIPLFLPIRNLSLKKLFAIAAFLVFGTGLFSCQSSGGELVGKVALTCDIMVEPINVKGELTAVNDTIKVVPLIKDTLEEEVRLQGEMVIPEQYALGGPRFVENPEFLKGQPVICVQPDTLEPIDKVVGLMVMEVPGEIIEPTETDTVFSEISIQEIPEENGEFPEVSTLIDLSVFPNPSSGRISISYELPARLDATLAVFDLAGKKRKDLFDIKGLYNGKYTLSADLSDLPSGTYFLVFTAGEQRKTLKVLLQK